MLDMSQKRIAILTFNFNPEQSGGVGNVVSEIILLLKDDFNIEPVVISVSNNQTDQYSRLFTRPKTWRNQLHSIEVIDSLKIHRIGSSGSEFEIFRYKKRTSLKSILGAFDILIVVTGNLQFCNVIPKIQIPVFVQCATRLKWERKSQYEMMPRLKRTILKLQIPILDQLEKKVLKREFTFLAENQAMFKWLKQMNAHEVRKWFPPISEITFSDRIQKGAHNAYVSVGRLDEPRKGWDRLFLAYDLACSQNASIPELKIIGRGDLSSRDKDVLVTLNSRGKIQILSNLSDNKRNELLQCATLFLQTSHEEGLGLAALEALQLGIPLICSETFGSLEYVDDYSNGRLIKQDSNFVGNFAAALIDAEKWDYSKFSDSSRDIFQTRFGRNISSESLFKILFKDCSPG